MSILTALAAPFTSSTTPAPLPASKAERDVQRTRDHAAAKAAEATTLDQLERLQVSAREARRARDAEIQAAHVARDRDLADKIAEDIFVKSPVLLTAIRSWRQAPSRGLVEIAATQLRKLEARSQNELGQPLRRLLPALVFAKTLADERPELASLFCEESFFTGVFGLCAQIAGANDRLLNAALGGDVVGADNALRELETAFSERVIGDVAGATARQLAKWQALLASGRESDLTARAAAVHAQHQAEDVSSLEAEQAAGADEASDEQYALETERLARFASRAYKNDTTHFDRLAAEQAAGPATAPDRT
jgi:hypothetical protein